MIDKLDVGISSKAPYRRSFAKLMAISESPEWRDKVWRDGGHYRRRGDLREVSGGELPVILHIGNKHDWKADDKVELVETGILKMSDMRDTIETMYQFEPGESRVIRLDLCSDIEKTPVEWFRNNTYFSHKQNHRTVPFSEMSSRRAQTIYAGQKPRQIRIYDKTGHRAYLLARETRSIKRWDRIEAFGGTPEKPGSMTFEQRWKYSPDTIVTRIERQMGGGEPKVCGLDRMGNLDRLAFGYDPFERIIFSADLATPDYGRRMKPEQRLALDQLRAIAGKDGIANARDHLFAMCTGRSAEGRRRQFYRLWDRYKSFVIPACGGDEGTSRAAVLRSFSRSINQQLAA